MGRIRDFSFQKEAELTAALAAYQSGLPDIASTSALTRYQAMLVNNGLAMRSTIEHIFTNVRAVEGQYKNRFFDKRKAVEFHNVLMTELINAVDARTRGEIFSGEDLLIRACSAYAAAEYARMYQSNGEMDLDYVTALMNSDPAQQWPQLTEARVLALRELYFNVTTVDENGVVSTDYNSLSSIVNSGYVLKEPGFMERALGRGDQMDMYELSPMAEMALTAYRASAAAYLNTNSHLAFSGDFGGSLSSEIKQNPDGSYQVDINPDGSASTDGTAQANIPKLSDEGTEVTLSQADMD